MFKKLLKKILSGNKKLINRANKYKSHEDIVYPCKNGDIRIFNNNIIIKTIKQAHISPVSTAHLFKDRYNKKIILSSGIQPYINVWDYDTGNLIKKISNHNYRIDKIYTFTDYSGKIFIISCDIMGNICIHDYDLNNDSDYTIVYDDLYFNLITLFSKHKNNIIDIQIIDIIENKYFIKSTDSKNNIYIWCAFTGELV